MVDKHDCRGGVKNNEKTRLYHVGGLEGRLKRDGK